MKKVFLALLAALGFQVNAAAQNSFANVDVEHFERIIQSDSVQIVDVRTPEEYASGHIAGALNLNVQDSTFKSQALSKLDKARPCAVYCRSGKRSALAASILAAEGMKVTNLLGGIIAWVEAGKPTTKD